MKKIDAKKATHMLGLKYRGGAHEDDAFDWFNEALIEYNHNNPQLNPELKQAATAFERTYDKFNSMYNVLFGLTDSASNKLYNSYSEDKQPVFIPAGWDRHSITVVIYNGYLIVGNRGEGMHDQGGTIIYKLPADKLPIKQEDLAGFYNHDLLNSKDKVLKHIEKVTGGDKNIISGIEGVSSKAQKYGTCSVANKKAALKGLVALLHQEQTNNNADVVKIDQETASYTKTVYKKFTNGMRGDAIASTIDQAKSNFFNGDYIDILAHWVADHHDGNKELEEKVLKQIRENPKLKAQVYKELQALAKQGNVKALLGAGYLLSEAPGQVDEFDLLQKGIKDFQLNDKQIKAIYNDAVSSSGTRSSEITFKMIEKMAASDIKIDLSSMSKEQKQNVVFDLAEHDKSGVVIKNLIRNGLDVNAIHNPDVTLFHGAALYGNNEMAKILITNRQKIDHKLNGITALQLSLQRGNHEVAKTLINAGANVNIVTDGMGVSPLIFAVSKEQLDIVLLLIKKGASINSQDNDGNTALMYAISNDNSSLVKLLLENGADIAMQNGKGDSILDIAAGKPRILELIKQEQLKKEAPIPSSSTAPAAGASADATIQPAMATASASTEPVKPQAFAGALSSVEHTMGAAASAGPPLAAQGSQGSAEILTAGSVPSKGYAENLNKVQAPHELAVNTTTRKDVEKIPAELVKAKLQQLYGQPEANIKFAITPTKDGFKVTKAIDNEQKEIGSCHSNGYYLTQNASADDAKNFTKAIAENSLRNIKLEKCGGEGKNSDNPHAAALTIAAINQFIEQSSQQPGTNDNVTFSLANFTKNELVQISAALKLDATSNFENKVSMSIADIRISQACGKANELKAQGNSIDTTTSPLPSTEQSLSLKKPKPNL